VCPQANAEHSAPVARHQVRSANSVQPCPTSCCCKKRHIHPMAYNTARKNSANFIFSWRLDQELTMHHAWTSRCTAALRPSSPFYPLPSLTTLRAACGSRREPKRRSCKYLQQDCRDLVSYEVHTGRTTTSYATPGSGYRVRERESRCLRVLRSIAMRVPLACSCPAKGQLFLLGRILGECCKLLFFIIRK
jgi:hypothetical protein